MAKAGYRGTGKSSRTNYVRGKMNKGAPVTGKVGGTPNFQKKPSKSKMVNPNSYC